MVTWWLWRNSDVVTVTTWLRCNYEVKVTWWLQRHDYAVTVTTWLRGNYNVRTITIELYPTDCWSGLQSIFCKQMITVIDIGKYTLRTIGSEVVLETRHEASERKSPFELITTMLYGPNADITKELRKAPISMSSTQLCQYGDWALNMTTNVEELYCILLNLRLRNTPQEYRSISKSFWSKLRNQRRKEKLMHHHVIAEDESSMILGDIIWIRRTNNLIFECDGISHRCETWYWEVCDDQCARLILVRNNSFIIPNVTMGSGRKTIKMDKYGQFHAWCSWL